MPYAFESCLLVLQLAEALVLAPKFIRWEETTNAWNKIDSVWSRLC